MTNTIVIEEHDYSQSIYHLVDKVRELRASKKLYKESIDSQLKEDKEWYSLHLKSLEAGRLARGAKEKLLNLSPARQDKYKETADELKEAEDGLSGMLEAHFLEHKVGSVTTSGGEKVVINRKFTLPARQMKLF